jgi:hypothetical protein
MPSAVRSPLIRPHPAHATEAHPLIRPDRSFVVGRWVNGESVMASIIDQMTGKDPDGFRSKALSVSRRHQEDVDAGVAVHGVLLLPVLDRADDLAIDFDDEDLLVSDELIRDLRVRERPPTSRDVRLAQDGRESNNVLTTSLTENYPRTRQENLSTYEASPVELDYFVTSMARDRAPAPGNAGRSRIIRARPLGTEWPRGRGDRTHE